MAGLTNWDPVWDSQAGTPLQAEVRKPRGLACIFVLIPACWQRAIRVKLSSQYNQFNKKVKRKRKKNKPEGIFCMLNIFFLTSSGT